MKYYQKANLYKASNVTFNPSTCEAYSYGWWRFVERISGQLVFNRYRYSNSTCKHQLKVWRLLRTLGLTIDIEIEAPQGLQDLGSAISLYEYRIAELKAEIAKPRSHARKNDERRQQIKLCQDKSRLVRSLIKHKQKQAA